MAVKQNNTETNATPSSVGGSGGAGASGGGKSTVAGGNASGGGTKAKKMNANTDGGGGTVDQPGCSGTGAYAKPKLKVTFKEPISEGVSGGANGSGGAGGISVKSNDISHILHLIELIEMKQEQFVLGQDILKIYQYLIVELARVQTPRKSPEELKRFKEDVAKVGAFFAKATETRVYLFYLRVVCQLITQTEGEPPSCAIAIIFQLFSRGMIFEAVKSLLEHKIPDENIKRTVRTLSEWLRVCNFCQNLNLWIMAILTGLQEQQKLSLFDEIALENIEALFTSLIIPVLRPKVAPIVFHMLSSINYTPQVFHKILPKFPKVINFLKQQSESFESHAEETKKFLQQLVDLTSALMVRFYGYDDLYEPVELALKDFQPSFNYLNYANSAKADEGNMKNDPMLHNTNAKVGLVNLGNTCYMNSVLQALAMTKEFSREILLTQSKSPLLIKMQQQIALMLYSTRYELTPSRVLNATRPPGFSPGLQQDSSEFLGYLLETLHEQEVTFRKKSLLITECDMAEPIAKTAKQGDDSPASTYVEGATFVGNANEQADHNNTPGMGVETTPSTSFNNSNSTTINSSSVSDNISPTTTITNTTNSSDNKTITSTTNTKTITSTSTNALSTIEKTFTGKLATTYKCLTCGWKSRNVDSFRDLQLSFPEVKNECASNYSVQDLIDYYCSPEKLDGENQYFCERCKKKSDAERYINVISAPKNLILTLKHFKYDQKYHMRAKLMHKVFHDEKVSLKVCSAETMEEMSSVHYDLYAGVVHSGFSMDSGHYYTYASDTTNKWYKFNDSIVSPSKSEELHNLTPPNTPYILFYQMGARSNESVEASGKVIKVDVPSPLTLDELPCELRDYVNHDNKAYTEELALRRFRNANAAALQYSLKSKNGNGRGGDGRDDYDDEDQQPPPSSGCGGNAMNINVNRFVY